MSTSTKTPASIRQGGPGSSHENAKAALEIKKPAADNDKRSKTRVSGGGGVSVTVTTPMTPNENNDPPGENDEKGKKEKEVVTEGDQG